MVMVSVCTAALIVVLSVFNGLEGLLRSLYNSFDPEIKIEATLGKSFEATADFISSIENVEGVELVTEVIEDYAYIRYRDGNMVVTVKGVSDNFIDQNRFDSSIVAGDLKLKNEGINYALVGQGIQYALSIAPGNNLHPLQVHYTKDVKSGQLDVSKLYSKKNILVGGVFAIEKNYDDNYIFVPLEFAQQLLDYGIKRTSLELKTSTNADISLVQEKLKKLLGEEFSVLNNDEQHADLYKLLNLEKLFVFLAFAFILFVGSINIFFSLSMLAIDKKKDISVLYSLGADNKLIKSIFLLEGAIISLGGASIGLLIGSFICWAQQNFGLVSMGMETSVLENYPVDMHLPDFIYTFLSLVIITIIISYRPAVLATKYGAIKHL